MKIQGNATFDFCVKLQTFNMIDHQCKNRFGLGLQPVEQIEVMKISIFNVPTDKNWQANF